MIEHKKLLLTNEEIEVEITKLAKKLEVEYEDKNPIIVCIIKGSVYFLTSLTQKMAIDLEIEMMGLSSYGNSATSSGKVKITKDIDIDITGRHVIVIEDIIDTGNTLEYIKNYFINQEALTVKTISLLEKKRQKKSVADIVLFNVPDVFIVGFGLDYANKYRHYPDIYQLTEIK